MHDKWKMFLNPWLLNALGKLFKNSIYILQICREHVNSGVFLSHVDIVFFCDGLLSLMELKLAPSIRHLKF